MAQARNRPRGQLALVVLAVFALLAVLVARAHAAPPDDDELDERGDDELEVIRGDDGCRASHARGSRPAPIGGHGAARLPALDLTSIASLPGTSTRAPGATTSGLGASTRATGATTYGIGPSTSGIGTSGVGTSTHDLATGDTIPIRVPEISAVVAAAYRAASLGHDPTSGWQTRSRLSALVPTISARAGQNESWRDVVDTTVHYGVGFDVRATWRLDRLLFDPNEPRFAMLDVARRRERRRLASLVIRVYVEWLGTATAGGLDAAALTAELDALTDGWFSEALAKGSQSR